MSTSNFTRRQFLATASAGTMAALVAGRTIPAYASAGKSAGPCACLGGKALRAKPFQRWPVWDPAAEESVLGVLRSGKWYRGSGTVVSQFEEKYAALLGAKRCVAVMNGTNALLTALHCLDVGVGDEVIVSPLHVHRHLQRRPQFRGPAGFRRHGPGDLSDQPGQDRGEDQREHPGDSAGAHLRSARQHDQDQRHRQEAQSQSHRRCLPGVAGGVGRQEVRHAGRPRLLQLPGVEAPAGGRGRRGRRQRRSVDGSRHGVPQLRPDQRQARLRHHRQQPAHDGSTRPPSCSTRCSGSKPRRSTASRTPTT